MYYDLLAKIKNAQRADKEIVLAPFSNFDFAVGKFLATAGYLVSAEKRAVGKKPMLEFKLRYTNGQPAMTDFKLVSKPSRHIYVGYRDLKPVRQNQGIGVISTPDGLVSNKEARKKKLGGEYLFEIW
ncbi:MAG TPA: 30S ribosomal protein S8 [Candidatus Paceibacterota bacterium]|nr:30S ribosomal protein S8 [Candidatus Paceibacterota bacterium]